MKSRGVDVVGTIARIILGALSGWLASIIMGKNSQMGALANIVVGIVGAFIGGIVFRLIGAVGVTGLNLWSLIVSVVGSCILLVIANKIKR